MIISMGVDGITPESIDLKKKGGITAKWTECCRVPSDLLLLTS
jgi:hypothetical protein